MNSIHKFTGGVLVCFLLGFVMLWQPIKANEPQAISATVNDVQYNTPKTFVTEGNATYTDMVYGYTLQYPQRFQVIPTTSDGVGGVATLIKHDFEIDDSHDIEAIHIGFSLYAINSDVSLNDWVRPDDFLSQTIQSQNSINCCDNKEIVAQIYEQGEVTKSIYYMRVDSRVMFIDVTPSSLLSNEEFLSLIDSIGFDSTEKLNSVLPIASITDSLYTPMTDFEINQSSNDSYILPFSGRARITQTGDDGFSHNCSGSGYLGDCKALDFAIDSSDKNIYATSDGYLLFIGWYPAPYSSYGQTIKIAHTNGHVSWYAHLSAFSGLLNSSGQSISQGEWIGIQGGTGGWPIHLHFMVKSNSAAPSPANAVDISNGMMPNLQIDESCTNINPPNCGFGYGGVSVHEGSNSTEQSQLFINDSSNLANEPIGMNNIRFVIVPDDWTLALYPQANYQGTPVYVNGGESLPMSMLTGSLKVAYLACPSKILGISCGDSDDLPPDGDYNQNRPTRGATYESAPILNTWVRDSGSNASGVDRTEMWAIYGGEHHKIAETGENCNAGTTCGDNNGDYFEHHWANSWGSVPDGTVTLYLKIRDVAGNERVSNAFSIGKYTDALPTISFNQADSIPIISNGQKIYSNDPNWSFSGVANDNNQVSRVQYSAWGNNGNQTVSANGTTTWTYSQNGLIGHNRIHFYAFDNGGQRSDGTNRHFVDLYVDTAAPSSIHNLSGGQGQNGWYNTPVQILLSANDNGSGNGGSTHNIANHYRAEVDFFRYRVDGGGWQEADGNYTTITVSGDGNHTVEYYAEDNVRNREATHSVSFKIDGTPPATPSNASEVHGVVSNQWHKITNNPDFTWTGANDNLSGVAGYQVYWGNQSDGEGALWRSAPTYNPAPVSTGTYYLRARSRDNAGNWSNWGTLFVFKYDGTVPHNPTVVHDQGVTSEIWQNSIRTADFSWSTPSDAGSGIAGYYIYWGTNEAGTSTDVITGNEYVSPTPICDVDSACTYYLRIQTKDNVGWTTDWVTAFTLRYDNVAPIVDVIANFGLPANQRTIQLDITANDIGSGAHQMRISNEGTNWTEWQPYITPVLWELPSVGRRDYRVMVQVTDWIPNLSDIVSDTVMLDVNASQPGSENFRLWDDSMNSGGNHSQSGNFSLRNTVGQSLDAPIISSSQYLLQNGYQAGALAAPTIVPTYTRQYNQTNYVIANGGTSLSSGNFALDSTIGQPAHNMMSSSSNYQIISGYWAGIGFTAPNPPPPPPPPPNPDCDFYQVSIEDGAVYTDNAQVTLNLCAPSATEVRISNDGGFPDAVWQTYITSTVWTLDVYGDNVLPRYVYVHFKDASGEIYGTFFDDIVYDPIPPQGTITAGTSSPAVIRSGSLVSGVEVWRQVRVVNQRNIDLELMAQDDNSGMWEMQISEDSTFTNAIWEPYSAFTTWSVSPEDGTKIVYARFRDRATNESVQVSDTFILDTTSPTATVSLPKSVAGIGTISVTLDIEAVDELSQVSEMRLSYSDAFTNTNWIPYDSVIDVPFDWQQAGVGQGEYPVIYAQFRDELGNTSAVYPTYYALDFEPPIGWTTVVSGSTPVRTVEIDAWDYMSEITNMWISSDYNFEQDVTITPYQTSFSWDFATSPVVYIKLVDAAGNFSERISAVIIEESVSGGKVYLPIVIK